MNMSKNVLFNKENVQLFVDKSAVPDANDELDLSNKNLTVLTVENFLVQAARISILDLSYNQLKVLDAAVFKMCPQLTLLNVAHNQIATLNANIFAECPCLSSLDVSFNQIKNLDFRTMKECQKLKYFNMSHNQIDSTFKFISNLFDPINQMAQKMSPILSKFGVKNSEVIHTESSQVFC